MFKGNIRNLVDLDLMKLNNEDKPITNLKNMPKLF